MTARANASPLRLELAPFARAWPMLRQDWTTLFDASTDPCVFYHPVFLDAAAELSPAEQPSHLVLGEARGALLLGLPVRTRHLPFGRRELTCFEHPALGCDHLTPLDATADASATVEMLRRGPLELRVSNVTARHASPRLGELAARAGVHTFRRRAFACPYLPLPDDAETLLASFGGKFAKRLKQAISRAQVDGIEIRLLQASSASRRLEDALRTLVALHEARFAATGRDSRFATPASIDAHLRICRHADASPGLVRFFEAVHEGRVIGSLYGFATRARFHFYQHGFVEGYDRYSLGSLLMYHAMARSLSDGCRIFDFMRGNDEYKRRWTQHAMADELVHVSDGSWLARSWLGWNRLERAARRFGWKRAPLEVLRNRD